MAVEAGVRVVAVEGEKCSDLNKTSKEAATGRTKVSSAYGSM